MIGLVRILLVFSLVSNLNTCFSQPPSPYGAVPSERQLEWYELEFYMFVHFNMNTFTDMEWGLGGETPETFDPTDLDCMQWAKIAKEAGMKGIIITAKHHDGFCLWPSKYTEHSVKNSPWKNGQGDVIRELREACDFYGLEMGIYYSPWDRNHADYGTDQYISYFHKQLTELLTGYGDIFEVWFDGANGGDGYYGGANEMRKVDRKTYYNWPEIWNLVRELQPGATIFSDAGPDVRWIGNESGFAGETNWATLNRDEAWPGWPRYKELTSGHKQGTHWVPGEVDVSIRPGWYYHESEDHKVRSLPNLLDIYYNSLGRNASFLLNIPIDRTGQVHEKDSMQLMALANQLKKDFADDLMKEAEVKASTHRLNNSVFSAENVKDDDPETYWSTDDFTRSGKLIIDFGEKIYFNRLLIQEYIPLGQRVDSFTVEVLSESGDWETVAEETTIGYKRILRLEDRWTRKVRLNIVSSLASPAISKISIYNAPKVLSPPIVRRDELDNVMIYSADKSVEVYFTVDGSIPDKNASRYEGAFKHENKGIIKAVVIDPLTRMKSPVTAVIMGISKSNWQPIGNVENIETWKNMIDGNPATKGKTEKGMPLVIDLGKEYKLTGVKYLPDQGRYASGIASHYKILVSKDGKKWKEVSNGEFSNIKNNPIEQEVNFNSSKARFLKFEATKTIGDKKEFIIAEIDVVAK
ncbi:alpha-L-fucosidase [Membranihabitans maritimus]|uniref:alpha-L-fucosidase n=1 Tax=Membranihabitans maritimus TaxID=2904244 RepID=UPI001EFFD198|nr:alpha-L-fucosidase [Membranihabitans maritimus]